jgi:hypothetical protein
MQCDWCYYELNNVYPRFPGYDLFNDYGDALGYTMCSINCCVAQIYKLGIRTDIRLEYIYENYGVTGPVKPAPNPNKLIFNGGNLTYTQYRQNFVCPPLYNDDYNQEEDYEFYDDDPYG